LNPLLPSDCVKDIEIKVDLRFGYSDEIEFTADAQHSEALLGHRFLP
jgi:hypothetical protein